MGDQSFFQDSTIEYNVKKIQAACAKESDFEYFLYEGERIQGKDLKPKDERIPQFVLIKHFIFKSEEKKNSSPMYETFQSFYKLQDLSDEPENDVGNYLLRLSEPIENDKEIIFFQKNKRYVNLINGFKKDKFKFIEILSKILFIYKKLHDSECLTKILDESFDRIRKRNLYVTCSKKNKLKVWIDFLNPIPKNTERLEGTPMEHLSIALMEWLYETEFEDKEAAIKTFNETAFPIDDELVKSFMKILLNKENLKLLQVLGHPFFSTQITETSHIWKTEIEKKNKKISEFEPSTSVVKDKVLDLLPELIKKVEKNHCLISVLSYLYLRAIVFYTKKINDMIENDEDNEEMKKLILRYKIERSKFIKKNEQIKSDDFKKIKDFIGFNDSQFDIGEFNEFLRDPLNFKIVEFFQNSKTLIIGELRKSFNFNDVNDEKNFLMINAEIWT